MMARDFNYNIAPQTINTAGTIQALQKIKTNDQAVPLPVAYNKNLWAIKKFYDGDPQALSKIMDVPAGEITPEMVARMKEEEEKKKKALLQAKQDIADHNAETNSHEEQTYSSTVEADCQEARDISEKTDKMWRDDLGGSWDITESPKVKAKISDMEAKKDQALQEHESKLNDLKDQKNSLEDRLESAKDDDEKDLIRKQLQQIDDEIAAEEAKKEEIKQREEEKINQEKEKLQQLKDKLYKLREEAIRYTNDLQDAKSYEDTNYWEDDVKRRLGELNLEIEKGQREIRELTRLG